MNKDMIIKDILKELQEVSNQELEVKMFNMRKFDTEKFKKLCEREIAKHRENQN